MNQATKIFGIFLITLFLATTTIPTAMATTYDTVDVTWENHETLDSHDVDDTDEVFMKVSVNGLTQQTSEVNVDEDDGYVSIDITVSFSDLETNDIVEVKFYDYDDWSDDDFILEIEFTLDGSPDDRTETESNNYGESTARVTISYPSSGGGGGCPTFPIC